MQKPRRAAAAALPPQRLTRGSRGLTRGRGRRLDLFHRLGGRLRVHRQPRRKRRQRRRRRRRPRAWGGWASKSGVGGPLKGAVYRGDRDGFAHRPIRAHSLLRRAGAVRGRAPRLRRLLPRAQAPGHAYLPLPPRPLLAEGGPGSDRCDRDEDFPQVRNRRAAQGGNSARRFVGRPGRAGPLAAAPGPPRPQPDRPQAPARALGPQREP
mmetsp:Transcript_67588/g.152952  ORF Transcript_67588/g.152952 Transcript_67588/m.152952 type:complete len:209 (-) Transcript_67588:406-1032(-)